MCGVVVMRVSNQIDVGWQIDAVRSRFVEAIKRYQKVEQENRKAYKDRLERQYKIGV